MAKLKIKFKNGEESCTEVSQFNFNVEGKLFKVVREALNIIQTDYVRLDSVSSFELSFESEDDKQ